MELLGHTGEVCGLKWRNDGELLVSGGNDNIVIYGMAGLVMLGKVRGAVRNGPRGIIVQLSR
jgi:hypothetical protein